MLFVVKQTDSYSIAGKELQIGFSYCQSGTHSDTHTVTHMERDAESIATMRWAEIDLESLGNKQLACLDGLYGWGEGIQTGSLCSSVSNRLHLVLESAENSDLTGEMFPYSLIGCFYISAEK